MFKVQIYSHGHQTCWSSDINNATDLNQLRTHKQQDKGSLKETVSIVKKLLRTIKKFVL
jgi:hypothetical protein